MTPTIANVLVNVSDYVNELLKEHLFRDGKIVIYMPPPDNQTVSL